MKGFSHYFHRENKKVGRQRAALPHSSTGFEKITRPSIVQNTTFNVAVEYVYPLYII